ncbi:MAG: DUF805 domain-containing protein [Sphingopyxis sp.]|uniref:DUF805 domain-containing protein n=1 Tax=Sphingopyxis sp. TaxID=1908224 RepID=UPI002ABAE3F9|nr:DUF805 domain-containing protein [Sphingopyxis sp.]MDZ3831226.1 DUF805 domain-containing protein [Sphingopyxis sp.]
MYTLFCILLLLGLFLLFGLFGGFADAGSGGIMSTAMMIPLGIFALATIIPSIAVAVRRLHDQDKSGWFYLLSFIPYVGGIILLVFMCIDGTRGPNRFGPDPKGGSADIFE